MIIGRDLTQRLANWARCHRWYAQRGRCLSVEGRSRNKPGQEVEYENGEWRVGSGPPKSPPTGLDVLDAWEIELAWRSLSDLDRWVIKLNVHDQTDRGTDDLTPWQGMCKCSRIVREKSGRHVRPERWWNAVRDARKAVRDAIAELESVNSREWVVERGEAQLLQVLKLWGITRVVDSLDELAATTTVAPAYAVAPA